MKREMLHQRLSSISTMWSVLHKAHTGPPEAATAAQEELLQRYGGAVYRYLVRLLGDTHAADELTQEFALSLVRGQFRGATPERGRFRSYVKAVLVHLTSSYYRKQKKYPRPLPGNAPDPAALAAGEDTDRQFTETWRDELLARTWAALARAQPTFHAVLRFRADHPKMPSQEMADELSRQLGKPITADGVRQTLRRARDKFADLLLEEVAHSLEAPTPDQVEQELCELNLRDYCRPALERYARDR